MRLYREMPSCIHPKGKVKCAHAHRRYSLQSTRIYAGAGVQAPLAFLYLQHMEVWHVRNEVLSKACSFDF